MLTVPRAGYAEATETVVTSYLQGPNKDQLLDLLANALPLHNIECRTWLYGNDLFVAKREADSAGRARKREIELCRIIGAIVILARPSNLLVQKDPQFG